ncbi:MAG: PAS domain-containing protein [Gammaproteobacteria bacterium]|nr:PAS domain-containing protein [Gammaproteobacteria bacterium]
MSNGRSPIRDGDTRNEQSVASMLRETETSVDMLFSNVPGMVYRCRNDAERTMQFVSAGAEQLTGYGVDDLLDNARTSFKDLIHPDDLERVRAEVERALHAGHPYRLSYRLVSRDGSHKLVWEQGSGVRSASGALLALEGYITDITDHEADELIERDRTERLRESEREILEMISSGAAMTDVLHRVILAVEDAVPEGIGSVLIVDPDGRRLRPAAAPHLPHAFAKAVDGLPVAPLMGSCGTAAHRREPVIATDIATDPMWAAGRTFALAHDLRACWSLPVFDRAGDVVATFALYFRNPRSPSEGDLELMAQMTHIVGIAIERERSETALRRNQALLDAASRITRLGAWAVEWPRAEITWSDEIRAIHEVDEDFRPTIDRCIEFYAPEHRPTIRKAFDACVRDGTSFDVELQIITARGRRLWARAVGEAIRDASGKIVRVQGALQDISERKNAEIALRERMKELKCLYRVLELTTTGDGPADDLFDEIASVLPHSLLHKDVAVARVVYGEREHRSAGWRSPVAALRSTFAEKSSDAGFVEVGYAAEREHQRGGEGPFLREERTLVDGVALHVTRMLQERRTAETLSQSRRLQAIGELTGGVAHDFNNLLTVILGNAELLMEHLRNDASARPLAASISKGAQRGAELTQRLLAFARRQALAPKPTDVGKLISSMDELLRRALGAHVAIRYAAAEDAWPALVDPGQLENALLNLCINARDAMPDGGRLTVEVANATLDGASAERWHDVEAGDYVMICVSDTGTGIAPDDLPRVFEPFFTTKQKGKGTGLGLSMVYGFAKQSQGHVNVTSEVGRGTTVRMYLPRSADRADSQSSDDMFEARTLGGSEKVLLVEDDELVRRYASEQLAGLGYAVLEAASGPEAVELVRRHSDIDLLFTDVVMPGGMSGREVAAAALALRPTMKVLYTSGYSRDAIIHRGRLDQGVNLLSKPYRRAELARRVRSVLDQR